MPRLSVFLDPDCLLHSESIQLSERESHHLLKVLRCRAGQSVRALDGKGAVLETVLAETAGKRAVLSIRSRHHPSRPSPGLALAFALPKGKTTDTILKTSVELGASQLYPLRTDHVEGSPGDKLEKWTLTLQEATKQSGNAWLPILHPLTPLATFLQELHPGQHMAVASLQKPALPLLPWLEALPVGKNRPVTVGILVGPEGDFSREEYRQIRAAGLAEVSLGPHILRSETAALAALATCASALWNGK